MTLVVDRLLDHQTNFDQSTLPPVMNAGGKFGEVQMRSSEAMKGLRKVIRTEGISSE